MVVAGEYKVKRNFISVEREKTYKSNKAWTELIGLCYPWEKVENGTRFGVL